MTRYCPVPGCTAHVAAWGQICFQCRLAGWRIDGGYVSRLPALPAGAYSSGD